MYFILLLTSLLSLPALSFEELRDFDYLDDYSLEVQEIRQKSFVGFTKITFRGKFLLKEEASLPEKTFRDLEFVLYSRDEVVEGVKPQLTVVFPNLSPLPFIDERIARGLAARGSHVLLLKTGITLRSYYRDLKDFNHILKHQLLGANQALTYSLNVLPYAPERIQVMGVSLGGLLSAALLALDERVSCGIIYMAGAGYEGSRKLGIIANIRRFFQGRLKEPGEGILFDAKNLEERLKGKRAKIYRTYRDLFVPWERQEEMEEVLDDPEVQWLRGMHVLNALTSPIRVQEYFEFYNEEEK